VTQQWTVVSIQILGLLKPPSACCSSDLSNWRRVSRWILSLVTRCSLGFINFFIMNPSLVEDGLVHLALAGQSSSSSRVARIGLKGTALGTVHNNEGIRKSRDKSAVRRFPTLFPDAQAGAGRDRTTKLSGGGLEPRRNDRRG
jgi:hypothetical protein